MSGVKRGVKVADLGDVISSELTIYNQTITEGIDKAGETAIKKLVKQTKATAPVGKRERHYKDSIKSKTYKTRRSSTYIWYVDGPDYRLSHLLENGHANRDGGRTPGTQFIKKATDPIVADYEKEVEEVIKNG